MKPIIQIEDLSFSYPDGINALKNINISICEDESIGIIGPNGAGKSTLLLCLNGVLRGNGKVMVDGTEINDKNIFSIRKKVGLVFQDPDDQLFCPTVYEDVSFGLVQMDFQKEEIEDCVKNALNGVGLDGYEDRIPHHLSFGERKRVTLAGVLAMDPRILVLDEPTSNLDPKGRRDFIDLLKTMNVTKIIATHDLSVVLELCSRVIMLDKGEIVANGSTIDILSNETLLINHNLELPLGIKSVFCS